MIRKTVLHRRVDLLSPGLTFPMSVKLKKRYYYKPPRVKVLEKHHQPRLALLSGNELLLFIERAEHCAAVELAVALRELSLRAARQQLQIADHPWVQQALARLEGQLQWVPRKHLLDLYRTVDRLAFNSEGFERSLDRYLQTTIHKLTHEEFVYLLDRMANRSQDSPAQQHKRGPQAYEYLVKCIPNRLEHLSPRDLLLCYFVMKAHGQVDTLAWEGTFVNLFRLKKMEFTAPVFLAFFQELDSRDYREDPRLFSELYPMIFKIPLNSL